MLLQGIKNPSFGIIIIKLCLFGNIFGILQIRKQHFLQNPSQKRLVKVDCKGYQQILKNLEYVRLFLSNESINYSHSQMIVVVNKGMKKLRSGIIWGKNLIHCCSLNYTLYLTSLPNIPNFLGQ